MTHTTALKEKGRSMNTIKFSHRYTKMPADTSRTRLLQVFVCDRKDLGELFVNYDTAYSEGSYELPKGKLIVLVLQSFNGRFFGDLWTTIRRFIPYKEKYYRSLLGQEVKIEIVALSRYGIK